MKKIIVVDTLNVLFRSYYAMRNLKSAKDEKPIGMIFGLLNFMLKIVEEIECDYVVFALDSSGGSFRKELLPDYKANRKELEPELKEQIPVCIELIKKSGFLSIEIPNYEADDIIASVSKFAKQQGLFTSIYSTDKDLYQLLDDNNTELIGKNYEIINELACIEKFGVKPYQMLDYLTLVGDSADNFKGIPGIGPVAAKKLLNEYDSLDNVYKNLNVLGNKSSQKKLAEHKDDAVLSKKLAKLVDDLPLGDFLSKASKPSINIFNNIEDELREFELFKFLKFIDKQSEIKEEKQVSLKYTKTLLDDKEELFKIIDNLGDEVGFDTETTGLNYDDKIVGFSFCNQDKSYYVPILHKNAKNIAKEDAIKAINKIFEKVIIGHNLKFDLKMLKNDLGISYPKKFKDSMIAAWLLDSSSKYSLDYLAKEYFDYTCLAYEEVVKKGENFSDIDTKLACEYASEDAFITKAIYEHAFKNLDDERKKEFDFECEFIKVLISLENNGITLNKEKLLNLQNILELNLKELENQIFNMVGLSFNLNSPKQLKEILYDKLKLPDNHKGSTNEAALQSIEHPIAELILEYRTASKVLSTYVLPLLELNINNQENFKVRSNFLQTGTATGRLSSNNPNLQNIPARSKYASYLKEAFIPQTGYSFISLDYSQIELRMLAHFSQDENLLKAFLFDEDIHTRTAIEIFGTSDKDKRNYAKSINFGLIYGMGARRLSEELKIPYSDASDYIKKYFASFSLIKEYFENTKKQTKDLGYIKTLLGRKRFFKYTNDIKINNANDRECINSILQGSAADLIKLAMIKIYPYLSENAKLILQIHDELIFEVKDEYVLEFSKIAQNIMENAYGLKVKLKTSLSVGKSWDKLK
ncbi:DNA polymerase I [Campylobacter sp. RM12642]|uniref:DNA polymerase I n=1 Tax=Campylobacter sp. RM12642 TaxID=2735736 RepID=UPI003014D535|nr:DNA polymerase I [Campylobacter sp. RM12642]